MSKLFKNKISSMHDLGAEVSFPRNFVLHVLFDAIYVFYFLGKAFIHPRLFCWTIMDDSYNLFFLFVSYDREKIINMVCWGLQAWKREIDQ